MGAEPATDIAERDDVVAVIVHQRRHQGIRKTNRTGRTEEKELVVGDGRLERMVSLFAPAGDQPVDTDRIDHGTGQDMCADFSTLFEHDDGEVRIDLFQPDRCRETGRACAHDHDVEFHAFAFRQFHLGAHSSFLARRCFPPSSLTKPNRIVEPKRDAPRRKFRQGGVKRKNILRARKGQCDDCAAFAAVPPNTSPMPSQRKVRRPVLPASSRVACQNLPLNPSPLCRSLYQNASRGTRHGTHIWFHRPWSSRPPSRRQSGEGRLQRCGQ